MIIKKVVLLSSLIFLFSGVIGQELKKAKKIGDSESQESIEFSKKAKSAKKENTISVKSNEATELKANHIDKNTLKREKLILKNTLEEHFSEINLIKGDVENWSQIEERLLQKIKLELVDFPFKELKLSTEDSDFRNWIVEADDISDIKKYTHFMQNLSESLNDSSTPEKRAKAEIKEILSETFKLIDEKKGTAENWSEIKGRCLQKVKLQINNYPFDELKLDISDDELINWINTANELNDLKKYAYVIQDFSKSL